MIKNSVIKKLLIRCDGDPDGINYEPTSGCSIEIVRKNNARK